MLFSILIPVYNVEKYLAECVESVLSQNVNDIEIILCNDGSTDSSGKICDEYAEKYPDIIKVIHKENEGVLLARRTAIINSKGKWLIFIDSDDYMLPNVLSYIKKIIESDNDLDLILCKIIYGQKNLNDFSYTSQLPFSNGQIFENGSKYLLYNQFLNGGFLFSLSQKIVKKSIVDTYTNYCKWQKTCVAEDYLQSLPFIDNSKKSVFINKSLIYYRFNKKSVTKTVNVKSIFFSIRSYLAVYKESIKYINKWNMNNSQEIYSRQLKSIAIKIFSLLNILSYSDAISIINELNSNKYIKYSFVRCNKKILGRKSFILYYLLLKKKYRLLYFLFSRRRL